MDNFVGSDTPQSNAELDRSGVQINDKIPTDVEGVFASGQKDNLYVFDIDEKDFYSNMKADRKRTRFSAESDAAKYLRSTKYNTPFYVRSGEYLRKVK